MHFPSSFKIFKKISPKLLIFFISILLISIISYLKLFNNFELIFYDWRLNLRPQLKTFDDIVVIEIDDYTLERLGTWPLPRDYHASLLEALKFFKAKLVVFDILFSEKSETINEADSLFQEALQHTDFVYLPIAFNIQDNVRKDYLPIESKAIAVDIFGDFKKHIKGYGHINTFVDSDGKIRRIPLFIKYNNELIPHLSLKAACDFLGIDIKNIEFNDKKLIIDKKLFLPILDEGSFIVNYPGQWKTTFKHFSYLQIIKMYSDVLSGIKPSIDPSLLKDKICFVGLTATGTADLKPIPFENLYPMLGLHPTVFNSIVTKNFIFDLGKHLNVFLNILIFLISFLICLKNSPPKALFALIIFIIIYFLIATGLFVIYGIWVVLFLPLLIIFITYLSFVIYKFLEELHKRKILERELDIARKIQESFLPHQIKKLQNLSVCALMQPAKFVAGDLYDIFVLDEKRTGIFIGDVSGKGVSAALIMAQAISLFRVFSRSIEEPEKVLSKLNKELCKVLEGRFITAFYVIIDIYKNKFSACCAGHLPPIMYKATENKVFEICPISGPPIGILEDIEYEIFTEEFNKGDKLLFYTDGVTEARNKYGEEFTNRRLLDLFFKYKDLTAQDIHTNILKELSYFSKNLSQHDDISLILLEHL
ncbi:MAG: CHASE2 domain-containing protein [Candidatus Omnitrophica bacterium]|nr:CHASE2 domain-containing protein [Candidatus Omnitrophota bacterium]